MEALPTEDIGSSAGTRACGGCHLAADCSAVAPRVPGPLHGVGLVVASLLTFLVPAVLALVGAAVAGGSAARQLLGGISGLLLGVVFAAVLARRYPSSPTWESCVEPR